MECLVSQPNSEVLDIALDSKGKGQECMDQLCRNLGIVEQDYFGLLYKGRGGENLWLNLRNRIDRQLTGPPPYRLQLKVKFFVQPHKLIQQPTRQQFYEQVTAEFNSQKLVAESEEQMIRMLALIVQAKHGNFDPRTQQMDCYKTVLSDICEPTPELINRIVNAHTHLVGLSKESAQYKLLQEAAGLQNYGFEYHEAVYEGDTTYVGIGPTGVFLYNINMELIEKLEYVTFKMAQQAGKKCVLKVMNDNGNERDIMLRLATQSAANAMYRCITEMHCFFHYDTVHNEVSTQSSRDLKGTLASLFNEETTQGHDYVFDIKRTSREVYDHARRLLHQPVPSTGTTEESMISDKDSHDCDTPPVSADEKCQATLAVVAEHVCTYTNQPCKISGQEPEGTVLFLAHLSHSDKDIDSILDPHDAYIFNQALKKGTGKDNYVRVNIVGYFAQGKTSLTRRLLNQSLEGVDSTDGIDVQKCKMKETEWEGFKTESDEHECLMRLLETAKSIEVDQDEVKVNRGKRKVNDTSSQTDQTVKQPDSSEAQSESYAISDEPSTSHTFATKKPRFSKISTVDDIANRDTGMESSFIMNYSRQLKDKSQMACENSFSANIWDFGGQFIYYATHQIFHSREAIYLLVFDMTKDLNEVIIDNDFPGRQRKIKNCLKFWLDSIHAFVGPDDDEGNEGQQSTQMQNVRPGIVSVSKPTVIFVGTHKDEFKGDITEKFNEVMKLFSGTKSRYHISPNRFAVSNTDSSDKEIEQLRNTILLLGKEHAESKQVPLKWIPLEMALLTMKMKNIITMEEVKHLNSENENFVEEDDMKTFLKYHHLKGTLIYFDEEDLEQHVVVNPQYLIDAFRCIIRSREFWVWNADLQPFWDYMNNTGILEKRLLDAVWSDEPGKDFSRNSNILLRFLQRHRILAELLVTDEDGNAEYQGRYMIPSLLKQCCEGNKLKQFHGRSTRTRVSLGLHTKSREVLSNMFERVTAAALGKWPPIIFEQQIMVFQNVGIFVLDRQHAGQIELTTRGVQLSVINQCQQEVEAKVCDHFRRYVESVMNNEFRKLKSRQKDKNTNRYYLSCNNHEHGGTGSVNIHEIEEVKEDELVRCPDHKNHSMECRKGIEEWFPAGKLSDEYIIPARRVSHKELVDIAGCLGYSWELLGPELGIQGVEIERIKMDCPGQTAICIYRMLQKWEQREQERATLKELIKGIECCKSLSVDNDGMKNIVDK